MSSTNDNHVLLGAEYAGNGQVVNANFKGSMDDVRLYNIALDGTVLGGMVAGRVFRYDWDNRLKTATANGVTLQVRYDPAGNRVYREVSDNGQVTQRKYIVGEVGSLPVVLLEITPGETVATDLIAKSYIYAGDQIVAQYVGPQFASGTAINVDDKYYYLHDRIGSVRQVMDKDAAVKWLYTYEPFGKIIESEKVAIGAPDNPWTFTGQFFDKEINQYYLRARQYDPELARFTGRDPVLGGFKEPLTLHAYLYCWNNPVNITDRSGEFGDFTAAGQVVINALNNSIKGIQGFYANQVLWRVGWAGYRAAMTYQWWLRAAPWVTAGMLGIELGLSALDSFASNLANNNEDISNNNFVRGRQVETIAGANLRGNFKTIDDWRPETGDATSMKSHALSSQDALIKQIERDLKPLQNLRTSRLSGVTWDGRRVAIEAGEIQNVNLLVAIPQNQSNWLMSQAFRDAISNLQTRYRAVISVVPVNKWKK